MKASKEDQSKVPAGEFVWRSVRYACAVGAGYFCGLSVGSAAKGPAFWLVAGLGLVGILWVFRSGKKSVLHAASDAVADARATATAAASAVSTTTVQVGNGNVVPFARTQGNAEVASPVRSPLPSAVEPSPLPPGWSDSGIWMDRREDLQEVESIDWDGK